MPDNTELAAIFAEMADILDIQGANPFRVRAYRAAVRTIEAMGEPIAAMVGADTAALDRIPGIGRGLHDKIIEYCARGTIHEHEELRHAIPPGLLDLLRLQSLGPKRVKLLYESLGIESVGQLEAACTAGTVRSLPGLGEKTEAKLLRSIHDFHALQTGRMPFGAAEHLINAYLDYLRAVNGIGKVEPAGSYRRRRESVGDLDILATVQGDAQPIVEAFVTYPGVVEVLAKGDTKASIVHKDGVQTDLRVVEPSSFGAALQYFTGSKEHNVALRGLAKDKGLKLSEYGVFEGDRAIAGATEEDVYAALGLVWIAPELRENRGEIDAAARGTLPDLVTPAQIRGDLHMHSTWSDGVQSIAEMARAAHALGYEYIAITDHSRAVTVAHGLTFDRARQQINEIKAAPVTAGVYILAGTECDILADGSLDYPDDLLAEFDFVIASVHSHFEMDEEAMTARIIRALAHPLVHCIGHPTGRLIGQRMPYKVNIGAVIAAAAKHHAALEINAAPDRLDLNETHAAMAREAGVPLSIATDAHNARALPSIQFGVNVARRAWCTPTDILNTWRHDRLVKWLKEK